MRPLTALRSSRIGTLSSLLTLPILLSACFFETSSSDLAKYQKQHPRSAHEAQIHMMFNDFKGLNTATLQTNAVPWKVAVASVVLKRHQEQGWPLTKQSFNQILGEFGFVQPSHIANLKPGVPQPQLEYPIGLIRGDLEMELGMIKMRSEIGNITCAVCHAGRTYDAKGMPQNSVWLGSPNTSINLEGYTNEIYQGMKGIQGQERKFMQAIDAIYPDLDQRERRTIRNYLIPEMARQINIFAEGSDTVLSFFNGPPGGANAIGSFKRVFGIYGPGYYATTDRGFVNIPDLSYRAFRRNLTVDGIYTPLGETPLTPVTEKEATLERAKSLGVVAAIFPIPVMGVKAAATEKNIDLMKEVFGKFIYEYRAPAFPGTISSEKALRGEKIYRNNCMQCHGEYSAGIDRPRLISYPNKLIPVEKIGTDPERLYAVSPKLQKKMENSWIPQRLQVQLNQGYMAPILSNVWSSAPYFHNGSVPSLWALMNPNERPERFYVGGHALDFENVGIHYPAGYQPWSKPILVDTSEKGLSNKGHESQFQNLSREQKKDLIEYLKLI